MLYSVMIAIIDALGSGEQEVLVVSGTSSMMRPCVSVSVVVWITTLGIPTRMSKGGKVHGPLTGLDSLRD